MKIVARTARKIILTISAVSTSLRRRIKRRKESEMKIRHSYTCGVGESTTNIIGRNGIAIYNLGNATEEEKSLLCPLIHEGLALICDNEQQGLIK